MTVTNALTQDPRLLLIDNNLSARREVVIRAALQELGKSLSVEIVNPSDARTIKQVIQSREKIIVMVVVEEDRLADLSDGSRLPRIPCRSIEIAYELIEEAGTSNDIYVITRKVTGVDVLSLLLSGVRGVIDTGALGSVALMRRVLSDTANEDKGLNRALIGQPYHAFRFLTQTFRSEYQLTASEWSLLLALAEIPVVKLLFRGNIPKQTDIAQEISKWGHQTGYVAIDAASRNIARISLKIADIMRPESELIDPKALGIISLLADNDDVDIHYLPTYVRQVGFPSRLLPIRGLDDTQLSTRLYKGLRGIEIVRSQEFDGYVHAHLTVARGLH